MPNAPWGYAMQALGNLGGAAFAGQAQRRAGDQMTDALANQMRVRQQIQQGISGQYQPFQQLGYGALMPLAALAGQRAGSFQPPQSRSFLASSPAYGPTYQGMQQQGGGFPLAALGSGGVTPDWSYLQRATHQTQTDLPGLSGGAGGSGGVNDTYQGLRNVTTGGRHGDLHVQNEAEAQAANAYLAANPNATFGDSELHGVRNDFKVQKAGLDPSAFHGLSAADQKWLLQQIDKGHTQHALKNLRKKGAKI